MIRSVRLLQATIMSVLLVLFQSAPIAESMERYHTDPEVQERLRELSAMLEESPGGFGSPIDNRETWKRISGIPAFKNIVKLAVILSAEQVPELTDDLYLDFSRTGNRNRYQKPHGIRRSNLKNLVIAECIENRGQFLPAIERYMRSICTEKTWVLPAHDRDLNNFKGKKIEIDLSVAMTAWNMATACFLLGDRLSAGVRGLVQSEMRHRVFDPFLDMVRTGENLIWWMTYGSNWNSVCIGGVVGSALAMIEPREERAWFLYGVERYAPNYLNGFTGDGYCSEGLGYWNYGFGHYLMLAEAVKQATGGSWDLLENDKVRKIAEFPVNLKITRSVYPAFSDCSINAQPDSRYMRYVSRRFGFGLDKWEVACEQSSEGSLYEIALFVVSDPASAMSFSAKRAPGIGLRSWFEDACVLICRPNASIINGLGVALKGGHNGEQHNNNDVGSYVAVFRGKSFILDPGTEVYTGRTFSSKRYESNVINSFGHPVPVVAGKLQKTGKDARAEVVYRLFENESDSLVIDITSAYNVPELVGLTRTFLYSRKEYGSLTVTDHVEFSSPQTFETALITFFECSELRDGGLFIIDGEDTVQVSIFTDGLDFEIKSQDIHEDLPHKKYPLRLGIALKEQVTNGEIRIVIRPVTVKY